MDEFKVFTRSAPQINPFLLYEPKNHKKRKINKNRKSNAPPQIPVASLGQFHMFY